jgi:hypothetical protein
MILWPVYFRGLRGMSLPESEYEIKASATV